jgi:hypothetical protein
MTSPEARGDLPWSAWITPSDRVDQFPRSSWRPPSERVDHLPRSAWIASLGARGSPSLSAWMVALGARGSPPLERVHRLPRSLGALGCALGHTDGLPRSPPGCQELWPSLCMLLRAHASQTSTKRISPCLLRLDALGRVGRIAGYRHLHNHHLITRAYLLQRAADSNFQARSGRIPFYGARFDRCACPHWRTQSFKYTPS